MSVCVAVCVHLCTYWELRARSSLILSYIRISITEKDQSIIWSWE